MAEDWYPHAAPGDNLKLYAYYYYFEPTGVRAIDNILSAVGRAGKLFHNTESWNDDPWGNGDPSPVEVIQQAANEAAEYLVTIARETQK